MSTIDRRSLLANFLPGAAVAAAGLVSVDIVSSARAAVASPLASAIFVKPNDMTEKIQVAAQDPRGPYHRRWASPAADAHQPLQCWYHRGRKRCGYR
jgi:hypothetical protein